MYSAGALWSSAWALPKRGKNFLLHVQTQSNRGPSFVLIIKKDLHYPFASIVMRKLNTFPFSTINSPWLKGFNIYSCIDHFRLVAKQHSSLPSIM